MAIKIVLDVKFEKGPLKAEKNACPRVAHVVYILGRLKNMESYSDK